MHVSLKTNSGYIEEDDDLWCGEHEEEGLNERQEKRGASFQRK